MKIPGSSSTPVKGMPVETLNQLIMKNEVKIVPPILPIVEAEYT